ncbi:MAG: GNAT family N-acetyltransferase [Rhodospirillaceae bacterium]|nr:GNAT family N-acetyltransferase [Rhodospirillaceae bacterium]
MSGRASADPPAPIRPAGLDDAEAMARIYIETWRSAYPGLLADRVLLDLSPPRQQALWAEVATRGGDSIVLVAEDEGGAVAGFVSAGPARPRVPGFRGEVFTLYVDQDLQGRGHGRALLAGAFARLVAHGLSPAILWVLTENPARFFYEHVGGRIVGRRHDRLGGQSHEERAYGWDDPAAAVAPGGVCSFRRNPIRDRP